MVSQEHDLSQSVCVCVCVLDVPSSHAQTALAVLPAFPVHHFCHHTAVGLGDGFHDGVGSF
jgi:hypothetical protein